MKAADAAKKIRDNLTDKQAAVLADVAKNRPDITILHGAVRSGKTYLDNLLWLAHVAQYEGHGKKFIMTGYTLQTLRTNVLDDLEEMFGLDCKLNNRSEFYLFGNVMKCAGTDKRDSYKALRGFTAYGHYGNEVTLSHKNSVNEIKKRCSGEGARLFWDTNTAEPTHYIKSDYIDRANTLKTTDGRYMVREYPFELDDNDRLDPEYIHRLKQTTPSGLRQERDIHGKWVAAEGVIYEDFRPAKMIITPDDLPELKRVWAGVDWGYDHYGVILIVGEDGDGNIYLLDEISARLKDIDWWKKKQLEMMSRWFIREMDFFCDSARPEYVRKFRGRKAKKEVVEGITFVGGLMKRGKFFVVNECDGFLKNINSYRWKESGTKEEPEKENDDEMDALRYAIYSVLSRITPGAGARI